MKEHEAHNMHMRVLLDATIGIWLKAVKGWPPRRQHII